MTKQKRRIKPENKLIENNYFSKRVVMNLTGLTFQQLRYFEHIDLMQPYKAIWGFGSFYTFRQIIELQTIQKANKEYGIKFAKLSRAKQVLKEIDESLDLASKSVLFAFNEVFLVDNDKVEEKIISLNGRDESQLSLIPYFALASVEKELDEKAPKIIGFEEYQHKKTHAVPA